MLLHRNNWILLNQLSHNSPSLIQLYPPILCKTSSALHLHVSLIDYFMYHLNQLWMSISNYFLEVLAFKVHWPLEFFNTALALPGLPSETKVFACPSICYLMLLLSPFISVQETNSFGNIIFPFVKHRQICWW